MRTLACFRRRPPRRESPGSFLSWPCPSPSGFHPPVSVRVAAVGASRPPGGRPPMGFVAPPALPAHGMYFPDPLHDETHAASRIPGASALAAVAVPRVARDPHAALGPLPAARQRGPRSLRFSVGRRRAPDGDPSLHGHEPMGVRRWNGVPRRGIPPPLCSAYAVFHDPDGLSLRAPPDVFQPDTLMGFWLPRGEPDPGLVG
jgi:hypothetical protein